MIPESWTDIHSRRLDALEELERVLNALQSALEKPALSPDPAAEARRWADLHRHLESAAERLQSLTRTAASRRGDLETAGLPVPDDLETDRRAREAVRRIGVLGERLNSRMAEIRDELAGRRPRRGTPKARRSPEPSHVDIRV